MLKWKDCRLMILHSVGDTALQESTNRIGWTCSDLIGDWEISRVFKQSQLGCTVGNGSQPETPPLKLFWPSLKGVCRSLPRHAQTISDHTLPTVGCGSWLIKGRRSPNRFDSGSSLQQICCWLAASLPLAFACLPVCQGLGSLPSCIWWISIILDDGSLLNLYFCSKVRLSCHVMLNQSAKRVAQKWPNRDLAEYKSLGW